MAALLALVVGTFISEDLTCVGAGLLVASGRLGAVSATAACALGIYAGDLGLWIAGRIVGSRALQSPRVRAVVPEAGVERFRSWFDRRAHAVVIGSRFAPGTRMPLYVAAGACRTSFGRFAVWSLVAVMAWTPLLVGAAAVLGDRIVLRILRDVGQVQGLVAGAVVIVAAAWWYAKRVASTRTRQRVRARVARIWQWEFWPMWLFYAPVAIWTAALALRHGGYRTLSSANPGMPDGGIVGESKSEILSKLPPRWTVASRLIAPGPDAVRAERLQAILRNEGWLLPVVLKPDVGQRGAGVRLVKSAADAAAYLGQVREAVIVQPFHPGPFEAGIFYYRFPGEPRGRVLSITDKHFPVVTGDGRSTLEDLVWAHPRYRMQARTFLSRLGERALEVPAPGERVRLAMAGNHAQGTMFRDGAALLTPALEARIDEIARSYEGFWIGRFDVRYSDREALMAGRELAIVELNGATAESTNIYDPSRSLVAAYRLLFRQWSLVFAIGAANRRAGHRPTSTRRLLRLLRAHALTPTVLPVSD